MNIAGETKLKISFFITEYKYKIMVLHTVGRVYICEYNFLTPIQKIATLISNRLHYLGKVCAIFCQNSNLVRYFSKRVEAGLH